MAKYKIANTIQISIGGENYKADKDGCYDLSPSEAAHLATVYQVVKVDTKGKEEVLGDGKANVEDPNAAKAEVSKEKLMESSREELDEKAKACGIKLDKDASKGDVADAIIEFLKKLEGKTKSLAPKK